MTTLTKVPATPARCVLVEPVGASLRETGYTATPELAVWVDRESGRTWLGLRFGRALIEVELEPGQVDTVTAGLLDEVPIPYELVDPDAERVCGFPDSDRPGGVCRYPGTSPCPQHGPREHTATWQGWW